MKVRPVPVVEDGDLLKRLGQILGLARSRSRPAPLARDGGLVVTLEGVRGEGRGSSAGGNYTLKVV